MAKKKGGAKATEPAKDTPDLNKMLQEARQKKKTEQLAAKIFGKDKTGKAVQKAKEVGGSLASRVGVAKRPQNSRQNSRANQNINGAATLPRARSNPFNRQQSDRRIASLQKNFDSISSNSPAINSQANVTNRAGNGNISVRGLAERVTVVAQNFAPGTTAGDIQSAVGQDSELEASLVKCILVAKNPTVIAELVFDNQTAADNMVSRFNNKRADGRVLHVYEKYAPPQRQAPGRVQSNNRARNTKQDTMDVDNSQEDYLNNREPHRPATEYQDGRYGFGGNEDASHYDQHRDSYNRERTERRGAGSSGNGLVSDSMVQNQNNYKNQNNDRGQYNDRQRPNGRFRR